MKPKQRVLNAISHKSFRDIPFQLDVTDATLDKIGTAWGFEATEEARYSVLCNHLVFARLRNPSLNNDKKADSLIRQNDAWGVQWASDREGAWVTKYPYESLRNLRLFKAPNICTIASWEGVQEAIQNYGKEYCIVGYQNALLFERAWSLIGFERLMIEMYCDISGLESFLDEITHAQMCVAERFVSYGIDVARTGDDWGGQSSMLFSPALWRRLIKPRLAKIWNVYQRNHIPIIHHSCGDIRLILDDLVDMGLDMLNPVQPEAMPIEEIADRYGHHLAFYGGISAQNILPFGTAKEVRADVERCVHLLGKNGGYIVAPSQSITSDVPVENIDALFESMQNY
jgi:uroporphyrinogen decarboxylase